MGKKQKRVHNIAEIPACILKPDLPVINDENCLSVNLETYFFTHECDVTLQNKNMSFKSHKAVLSACSTVFKNILDGDSELTTIPLIEISDDVMKVLQKLIY